MKAFRSLVSNASAPLGEGVGTASSICPPKLKPLLTLSDGFFAFDSSLHVFPSGRTKTGFMLGDWNDANGWRAEFRPDMPDDVVFFAEDIFGCQFGIDSLGKITTFDPETCSFEACADSLEDWAIRVLESHDVMVGSGLGRAWQSANGPLAPGFRLIPVTPFFLGGDFEIGNLYALEAAKGMSLRADIWRQTKDLPPGAKVSLKVE